MKLGVQYGVILEGTLRYVYTADNSISLPVCANSSDTLKCLSIGTPKIINFPFGTNGKFIIFRCPNT